MGRCSENPSFQTHQIFLSIENYIYACRISRKDSELAKGLGPDPTALSEVHVLGGMGEIFGFEGLECWQ